MLNPNVIAACAEELDKIASLMPDPDEQAARSKARGKNPYADMDWDQPAAKAEDVRAEAPKPSPEDLGARRKAHQKKVKKGGGGKKVKVPKTFLSGLAKRPGLLGVGTVATGMVGGALAHRGLQQ
jgi:hypothetical protein